MKCNKEETPNTYLHNIMTDLWVGIRCPECWERYVEKTIFGHNYVCAVCGFEWKQPKSKKDKKI
jgi:uncharacterized protein (DUF983 family)